MLKKFLPFLFILSILVGSFSLAQIFRPQEGGALVNNSEVVLEPPENDEFLIEENIIQSDVENNLETIIPIAKGPKSISVPNGEKVEKKESARLEIFSTSGRRSYILELEADDTVEKIMGRAQKNGLKFSVKNFGGLGSYVTSINGVKEDAKKGMFWIYYVNGKKASAGISNQKVFSDDIVQWRYEKI